MTIAKDQRRWVRNGLRDLMRSALRDDEDREAPLGYLDCRAWDPADLLWLLCRGDEETEEAVRWSLARLEKDDEITIVRSHDVMVGVWFGPRRAASRPRSRVPADDRLVVMERDGYACVLCESTTDLTIDHIFPVRHGGSDDPINLRVLCRSCNSAKGAVIPDAIRMLGRER